MAFILTWIQIDVAYFIDKTANRQLAIYAAVAALAIFYILIAAYVALGRRGGLLHWGEPSLLLGFTGVAAGANLLLNCGQEAWAFYKNGVAPPPYYTVFSNAELGGIDKIFLNGTLICGVLAGVSLLAFGLLWMFGGRVSSVFGQWMSLIPILWAFCRLARYVQSYASTIRNAFSTAQAALLILSLLFFYMLGQHLNGRTRIDGTGLPACAFAFGIIAISAFCARCFLQAYCPETVAGVVIVADVTDLLCGVFALAVGAVGCSKKAAEKTLEYLEAKEAAELSKLMENEGEITTVPLALQKIVMAPAEEPAEVPAEEPPLAEEMVEAPVEVTIEEMTEVPAEETDITE